MSLEQTKEQLKERFDQARRQVQDSSTFILAKEKYDLLPPTSQKLLLVFSIFIVAFALLAIPLSMLTTAEENIARFESDRKLTHDLLRVQREIKQGPVMPVAVNGSSLEARVNSIIDTSGLLPEQKKNVEVVSSQISALSPKEIQNESVLVQVAKLNLRQLVDLGYAFDSISPTIKLSQLKVEASKDNDHYFDVQYEVTTFYIPIEDSTEDENKPRRGRN